MSKKTIVLTGGSGSGKSFYEKFLNINGFEKFVSHTTREARIKDNEKNGVDYYFVTKEEFKNVEMLETTIVKDNFYGLSLNEYLSKNNNCVVVVDPNGTKQLIDKLGKENLVTILLDIDLEERKQNMLDRGDTIEAIEKRLLNEDFVNDYYDLGLNPDILIQERLDEPKFLLDKINDFLNIKIDIER